MTTMYNVKFCSSQMCALFVLYCELYSSQFCGSLSEVKLVKSYYLGKAKRSH